MAPGLWAGSSGLKSAAAILSMLRAEKVRVPLPRHGAGAGGVHLPLADTW